ncbi:ABC transporter related protein [Desulfarculus baarsii DSM 2075]|uniref:ABC transporter related protein n=1 Tax=Desulfarculus baarsii (strain ATCC 33931 / DSM 2075 / LMG 7858 / VKM B-1802 / 2st14) TaxID=644282 RepID=E1QL60_DESB2|nr:ABC transporter related protein [Desulfarculus baarsii DSM 2075]
MHKLVKVYGRRRVVDDVSLEVNDQEIVGLLGPNGAGKTTSFYMTVGMIHPTEGDISLNDETITQLPMYQRARKGISYLPQESSIFQKLSVEDNIKAILQTLPLDERAQEERLERLLDDLGVGHLRKNKAYSLSGGERRRVEISRLLVTDPKFILLDEPFAGIDPIAVGDLQEIIRHLRDRGIGVLISDHNVRETLCVCDRAYILAQGKVIEQGDPEHIAQSEVARRIYLGEEFSL